MKEMKEIDAAKKKAINELLSANTGMENWIEQLLKDNHSFLDLVQKANNQATEIKRLQIENEKSMVTWQEDLEMKNRLVEEIERLESIIKKCMDEHWKAKRSVKA